MTFSDMQLFFQWWIPLFIIGILFFVSTKKLFSSFLDHGYIFSKVIGIVVTTYAVYLLGTLRLVPFDFFSILIICVGSALLSARIAGVKKQDFNLKKYSAAHKSYLYFIAAEEILFTITLFLWSYIRAFQPDIHGLEKYMDLGFVNSILKTNYFPAADMWLTPLSINYYYFGHLITALLIKLSNVPSNISYNFMIATLFAFTVTCSFSLVVNMLQGSKKLTLIKGGLLGGYLVACAGNVHTIYSFFAAYQNEFPKPFWNLEFLPGLFPNAYWYPNATRFIYNTIHEFPLYSFVVSDLHGHVLGIPIVLTIIAILLHTFVIEKVFTIKKILLLSFLIACAYMTNALDGPIYILFTMVIMFFIALESKKNLLSSLIEKIPSVLLLFIGFLVFSLPFSLHFNSFVSGVGILCAPDFLVAFGKIGPFLFEIDHCQKSPLWQLFILYGFFWIWGIIFFVNMVKNKMHKTDLFVLALFITAFFLTVIPEFIYFKDIYPAHYRANTMFKLGYQAFMMFSLASAYTIVRSISLVTLKKSPLYIVGFVSLGLVALYPYFAINAYYTNLQTYYGLDGTAYLKRLYPTDYDAIAWIGKNIQNQPVILEAQGDSYTDYARISTHTGLPTVLGWTVHEWLWRGSYSIPSPRIADVQQLYETNSIPQTQELIRKYHISYVFIGTLERQKYPNLNENKFEVLGKVVYQKGETKIYRIN